MNSQKNLFKFSLCLIFLLLFSLLAATGCKKKMEAPPPPPPTPTPVVPAGSVVFIQKGHLARLDLESSQITPLTSGKSTEWFPACSPKGDQVLYWSNFSEGNAFQGTYNLWKINLDATSRTQLTFEETDSLQTGDQNLRINAAASWSPDGRKIFYSINGDIWMMDSEGYNPESVLLSHNALCPVLSPDGKTVVYITNAEDQVFNLWILTLEDKTVKKITNYTDWNVGSPSYSMDGKKILFNLYRANVTQVYTVNAADGTEPLNLTNNNRSLCPKFAMNDRKIVYCSFGTGDDLGLNLFIVNSNGTETKALTTEGGSSPSWAPARVVTAPLPTPVGK